MRLWMRAASDGICPSTVGGDTPFCSHRLWRDPHLCWQLDRDRLQVPVQRVISYEKLVIELTTLLSL